MARVLEARRVLVQETDNRTLSPTAGGGQGAAGGSGSVPGPDDIVDGTAGPRRRRVGGFEAQEAEASYMARPDSPTSIATRFSEIFGRDALEERVVSPVS
jgi:hypothetical protein